MQLDNPEVGLGDFICIQMGLLLLGLDSTGWPLQVDTQPWMSPLSTHFPSDTKHPKYSQGLSQGAVQNKDSRSK